MVLKSILRPALFGFLSMACLASAAVAQNDVSCPTLARKAAQEWGGGVIQPFKDSNQPRPADASVLISGGHTYLYTAVEQAGVVRTPHGLGAMARDYNTIYRQNYDRCQAGERGVVIVRSGLLTDVKIIR